MVFESVIEYDYSIEIFSTLVETIIILVNTKIDLLTLLGHFIKPGK